jgi:hypothetical protein
MAAAYRFSPGARLTIPFDTIGVDLAITGDPMAGFAEAGQLLDLRVEQLAWPGIFVTVHWRRLQVGQLVQANMLRQLGDGAWRYRQLLGDLAISLP